MVLSPWTCSMITQAVQLQADAGAEQPSAFAAGDPRLWLVVLAAMALAPFLLTMITSFVKLVVVGSIIRSALGTQQVPPTQVITGLALILSIHVMWPVGVEIYDRWQELKPFAQQPQVEEGGETGQFWGMMERVWDSANPPIRKFLLRHSHPANLQLFQRLQRELRVAQGMEVPQEEGTQNAEGNALQEAVAEGTAAYDMTVLIPAFVVSELTEAFQIGFLIFVPFLIIDMVVANLLLAMGMMMLQPTTVSLPLKLLLFVLIDGWQLIIRGVILGYT